MKIKKYTNGAWTDLDKPVKKYDTYIDEATTLPLTIQTSATDAVENYQVYGASGGVGEATSGDEPQGYKIPILNTSGVTENLWDGTATEWNNNILTIVKNLDNSISVSRLTSGGGAYPAIKIGSNLTSGKKYTLSFRITGLTQAMIATHPLVGIRNTSNSTYLNPTVRLDNDGIYETPIIKIPAGSYAFSLLLVNNNATITFSNVTISDIIISERYTADYNIYIGSTKLSEEEYVDFESQKVYRYVDSVLTPQDPPVPLPPISTYIGENNISVDTTVQPEKVACEYQGWKGIGDVEKYQNGEWSDNNDI